MVTHLDNDYWTRLSNPLDTSVQLVRHVRRRKHILLFTYTQKREKESPRQSKISY